MATYDSGKKVKGRKRHLLVDTDGTPFPPLDKIENMFYNEQGMIYFLPHP